MSYIQINGDVVKKKCSEYIERERNRSQVLMIKCINKQRKSLYYKIINFFIDIDFEKSVKADLWNEYNLDKFHSMEYLNKVKKLKKLAEYSPNIMVDDDMMFLFED